MGVLVDLMNNSSPLYRASMNDYWGEELTIQIANFKKAWAFFNSLPAEYIAALKDSHLKDSVKNALRGKVPDGLVDHIGVAAQALKDIEECGGFDNAIQNALTTGIVPEFTFRDSLRNLLHLINLFGRYEDLIASAFDNAIKEGRESRAKIPVVDLKRLDLTRLSNEEILMSFDLLLDQYLLHGSDVELLGETRDRLDAELDRRGLVIDGVSIIRERDSGKILIIENKVGDVKQDRNYGYVPTPDKYHDVHRYERSQAEFEAWVRASKQG